MQEDTSVLAQFWPWTALKMLLGQKNCVLPYSSNHYCMLRYIGQWDKDHVLGWNHLLSRLCANMTFLLIMFVTTEIFFSLKALSFSWEAGSNTVRGQCKSLLKVTSNSKGVLLVVFGSFLSSKEKCYNTLSMVKCSFVKVILCTSVYNILLMLSKF